ncbi:hypothetical protein RRG08_046227 [Elysia crispata]|uniref:Uncharacterized protein n=1 Tax=Elysia crispata TaxID=231223 RepID=A0AAE1D1N4_9GAST|nr:hypothetical protein RRG08_046227 [Elysia crispata]
MSCAVLTTATPGSDPRDKHHHESLRQSVRKMFPEGPYHLNHSKPTEGLNHQNHISTPTEEPYHLNHISTPTERPYHLNHISKPTEGPIT